jgi:hypothetical protein
MGLGLVNLHDFHVGLIQATKRGYMNSWDYSPSPHQKKIKEELKKRRRKRWDKESWNVVIFSNVSSFGSC